MSCHVMLYLIHNEFFLMTQRTTYQCRRTFSRFQDSWWIPRKEKWVTILSIDGNVIGTTIMMRTSNSKKRNMSWTMYFKISESSHFRCPFCCWVLRLFRRISSSKHQSYIHYYQCAMHWTGTLSRIGTLESHWWRQSPLQLLLSSHPKGQFSLNVKHPLIMPVWGTIIIQSRALGTVMTILIWPWNIICTKKKTKLELLPACGLSVR